MHEKRKYVRANGLVLVNYKIPELSLEGKSSAFDVSGAGLRITVNKKLKPGVLAEMEIYLPGSSQPLLAKGEVMWSEPYTDDYFYAGIKFSTIDKKTRTRIIDYVHRKLHQTRENS